MTAFEPKYLESQQVEQIYKQALQQAEGAVLNAWLQLQGAPEDATRLALYEVATDCLKRFEKDLERVNRL